MTMQSLQYLFSPRSIAILGLEAKEEPFVSAGRILLQNIVTSGFEGVVYPIHSSKEAMSGISTLPTVKDIVKPVDLAVLSGPPEEWPGQVAECGEKAVRSIMILGSDFRHRVNEPDKLLLQLKRLCSKYDIRLLGPNTMGFIRPRLGLNVSTGRQGVRSGGLAFVSQSSTLAAGVLDYAIAKHIGFSSFISLGSQMNVDFADLLDFLSIDPDTKAIVLYMEHIENGRKFVGAARAFARAKPLMVVKGGRYFDATKLTAREADLFDSDAVYDAVFKRAGMVRVDDVLELFHLSESLGRSVLPKGNRLLIVTNAGGPSVMAVDMLLKLGGSLARLSGQTVTRLNQVLPFHWSGGNPVDILSDAGPDRFEKALDICMAETEADGVLVILTPQFLTKPMEMAQILVKITSSTTRKTILACWMGSGDFAEARDFLDRNGIPTFVTPEHAVKSFLYMHTYGQNNRLLSETPANILEDFFPDSGRVEQIFNDAIRDGRHVLYEREAKAVLAAYGISSPPIFLASSPAEAISYAEELGVPVALKVESPSVLHKTEVGGVKLHLRKLEIEEVFEQMVKTFRRLRPDGVLKGITVQPMALWPGFELLIGMKKDPVFGSVILFGAGGRLLNAMQDYSVALPPLNQTLARRLLEDTRIYRYLRNNLTHSRPNLSLLEKTLLRFSQLVVDFPQIQEIDINPFFLGELTGLCLDAKIILEPDTKPDIHRAQGACCPQNLVICPYPCHYVDIMTMRDGTPYLIRPIKPEDEPLMYELFSTFSPETIRMRFFQHITSIPHEQMARYCQIDYDREIALVATITEDDKEHIIGVGRLTILPDRERAEFAVVVGDPWQGQGVGKKLMGVCIEVAMGQGIKQIFMDVLRENGAMRGLAARFGFEEVKHEDEELLRYVLDLSKPARKKRKNQ